MTKVSAIQLTDPHFWQLNGPDLVFIFSKATTPHVFADFHLVAKHHKSLCLVAKCSAVWRMKTYPQFISSSYCNMSNINSLRVKKQTKKLFTSNW